ncbi:uncharacterized protein LOC129761137 [Toxorhynchites rutilus septentrionalis]|uniref:uncharacterized protein LOC129761137 n=1 Tax=Toxorhynchites rutilus septentrionalis TaxID=329112 RepID=UPI0024783EA0|nr:uncharacterized protein LOC129761137 [Toxorhynchites rutilus septentrionalis]
MFTPYTPEKSISEQKAAQKLKQIQANMEEQLRTLTHQRGAVEGKLTRVKSVLQHSDDAPNPNIRNLHFLRLHMKTVEQAYSEYNQFQNSIYALSLSEERRAEQMEKYVEFESMYTDLSIRLSMLIEEATTNHAKDAATKIEFPAPAVMTAGSAAPFLPPLQAPLPTFDGSYEGWFSFKSMFTTIMNRYKYEEPAMKLYHLRNCLVGAAAGIIDQDIVNSNDYDAAWKFLTERFEDKRLIIDKHIECLFNLPRFSKEHSTNLRKLLDVSTKNVEALKKLELPVEGLGEQMLVNIISSRMDKATRVAWETRQESGVLPSYSKTMAFLQEQCRIIEKIETNTKIESGKTKAGVKTTTLVNTNEPKCDMKIEQKCAGCKERASNERMCFITQLQRVWQTTPYFSSHHRTFGNHTSKNQCADRSEDVQPTRSETTSSSQSEVIRSGTAATLCASVGSQMKQALLSTAIVKVRGLNSAAYPCRVLLDSASQMHFITERFANLIGQKKQSVDFIVSGLNGANIRLRRMVRATIESYVGDFFTEVDILVAPRITSDLPEKPFDVSEWPIPADVKLADPEFNKRGRIDMLIGAEIFWDLVKDDRIKLGPNLPTLTNTELGWVAGGIITTDAPVMARSLCQTSNEELSELLRSFYKLEACDVIQHPSKAADEQCLEHFRQTHQRDQEGRYCVRHPFNDRKGELGDSRAIAIRRFLSLERRLDREPNIKQQYSAFMREYEELGHMKAIAADENEDPNSAYYIPHHCVVKPSSTTTKLRVVFDGSTATSTGVAINDALMSGPTVQNDLTSILLNFRCFKHVFTVDIPKMFRQVRVLPPDTAYQRIIWRYDRSKPLAVYELQTVTYGLAPSPFQATMALRQASEDYKEEFPRAAKVIERSTYMDDIVAGAHNLPEACVLQQEIDGLLSIACFGAHKWCSKSLKVLDQIGDELRGTDFKVGDENSKVITKTLGIVWNPPDDWFSFSVTPGDPEATTKRKILSEVAKIYDLLGLVGPVVTTAKLILQEVSLLSVEWDEPVPQDIVLKWRRFRDELTCLN